MRDTGLGYDEHSKISLVIFNYFNTFKEEVPLKGIVINVMD